MSEFSRKLPPLSTLVVFEAACRLHSFSRAADECALSQASIIRQMKQLEDKVELKLFERHRYEVSPTDAGTRLYATVRHTLGDLARTAESGEGIALGWGRSVSSRIADGKLMRFTDLAVHVPDGISVYMRKRIDPHPLASEIIDLVRDNIKRTQD